MSGMNSNDPTAARIPAAPTAASGIETNDTTIRTAANPFISKTSSWHRMPCQIVEGVEAEPSGTFEIATRASPGDFLPVAEESSGRVVRQHYAEDDRPSADGNTPRRPAAAHVGAHPPLTDRIDSNPLSREVACHDAGECIARDVRRGVGATP